jgi:hypothetical protein
MAKLKVEQREGERETGERRMRAAVDLEISTENTSRCRQPPPSDLCSPRRVCSAV